MLLAVYSVVSGGDRGWTSPTVLGGLVLAAALLTAFVMIEKRLKHPLVRLGILKVATLVRANLSVMALMGSYLSFQFMMTLYLQDVLGWSPLKMAMALLPAGVLVAVVSPFMGKLIDRFGTPSLILTAMASMSLGYVWFLTTAGSTPGYAFTVFPTMLLLGGGFAFGFSSIMAQATEGIHDDEQGLASGLVQTSMQVGAALVLAVVTGLLGSASTGQDFDDFHPGVNLVTGVAVVGLLLNVVPLLRRRGRERADA
jgi:predicted MFS family arabinose efflux permease